MDTDMALVGGFASEIEAELAVAVLDAHGIDAAVVRDSASGMIPSLNVPHPIRLAVPAHAAARAAGILGHGASPDDAAARRDDTDGAPADVR